MYLHRLCVFVHWIPLSIIGNESFYAPQKVDMWLLYGFVIAAINIFFIYSIVMMSESEYSKKNKAYLKQNENGWKNACMNGIYT